jgi:hypothetical protein
VKTSDPKLLIHTDVPWRRNEILGSEIILALETGASGLEGKI